MKITNETTFSVTSREYTGDNVYASTQPELEQVVHVLHVEHEGGEKLFAFPFPYVQRDLDTLNTKLVFNTIQETHDYIRRFMFEEISPSDWRVVNI